MREIVHDTAVRSKYHEGFDRNGVDASILVIHGSAGHNPYIWVRDAERLGNPRVDRYKKGIALWHFTISKKGEIMEMIDPKNWVYHSSSGKSIEPKTIGVEIEHRDNGSTAFLDEQYEALGDLILHLMGMFPIYQIASHKYMKEKYGNGSKQCPGPGFEWNRLKQWLSENGYNFVEGDENFDVITRRTAVV